MTYMDYDPIAEVRQNRALLLTQYGGVAGLHQHMQKERAELEKQGWKFVSLEEVLARKQKTVSAK